MTERGRSPLAHPDWTYVEAPSMEAFRPEDWAVLGRQRAAYQAEQQARQALRLLECSKDDPTFGYQVNAYQHCLQSATLAMRDGLDEETVVVALFHDVGLGACPETHGEFAAALLGARISDRNRWMLCHHAVFQQYFVHGDPSVDRHEREQWRGHPHYAWTAEFVEKYDQNAIRGDAETAPLEAFEPMVKRLFSRP